MADPTNKAELLERMQSGYAAFETLLAPLSSEQLSAPGVNGAWAVKDVLVHLAAWQTRVSIRLEAIAHDKEPQLDLINTDEKMDAFNHETFVAHQNRPPDEILADFHATVQRLRKNVETADEGDLFEPGRFAWLEGGILWQSVAGNTFEHYEEHAPMIEAWLAGQRA